VTTLNLHQLECFVKAADTGTMTAAASDLRLSPSAISLSIGSLEAFLGTQLLIRQRSRGLTLTAAGQQLLPRARELLAFAEDVVAEADQLGRRLEGRLDVGCYRMISPFLVPGLLHSFTAMHHDVQLEFAEGSGTELEKWLLEGRCELALTYDFGERTGEQLVYEPLCTVVLHALFAPDHPLASLEEVSLGRLASHDLIMFDGTPGPNYVQGLFGKLGLTPQIRFTVTEYELARSLVARNFGYGLQLSQPYEGVSYEGHPIVARPVVESSSLPVTLSLARVARARLSYRARAFRDHCRETLPVRWARPESEFE
jgi:DNA-binding transcriptional LysR family regulator